MGKSSRISEAEWQVMKILWARSPITANDVIQTLTPITIWKPKTIKTLIDRLVRKKVVGYEKAGRAYLYFPLVDEAATVRAETRSFLKRVYGGALKPMLANFLEGEELSKKEIEELKRMLDERG